MEKGKIKWLDNKNALKITALFLAIMLWFYVAVTQDPARTDRVENVEVICGLSQHQINQGLSIISKSDSAVAFEATGKRSLVTGVRGTYYAQLDLEDITAPGKYNVTPQISKPEGVYISSVTPPVIEVYVDRYVSSTLPVSIETKGKLGDNLVITDMTADLTQIDVQLPSLALEQIAYVGAIVNLSEIESSTVISCEPVLLDSSKKELEMINTVIDKKNIIINITVEQIKNVKISPKITDAEKYAKGLSVSVIPKTIDLLGNKEVLDAISQVETVPVTLGKGVKKGDEIEVKLQLPVGTKLKANVENVVKIVFN